jgi:hypothetical protein
VSKFGVTTKVRVPENQSHEAFLMIFSITAIKRNFDTLHLRLKARGHASVTAICTRSWRRGLKRLSDVLRSSKRPRSKFKLHKSSTHVVYYEILGIPHRSAKGNGERLLVSFPNSKAIYPMISLD